MIRAAGILFLTASDQALFLRWGEGGDHAGEWCFPGGRLEGDETPEAAAVREAREEAGPGVPDGPRRPWTTRVSPVAGAVGTVAPPSGADATSQPATGEPVEYVTFVQRVAEEFPVVLSDEHTGYAWASVDAPPEPLHPGVRVALARLTMDELGVARAIAAGELTSPQRYENVSLFALRITGTGTAYRRALDEYVYRRPENYLTPEFLARCNGLPVIMQHPRGRTLDSKEFTDRVVGSILLPYILGDEVWGVAKVYDDAAIQMMTESQLSTSPAVVFRDPKVNSKMELEDGSTLLIEGKPSLLDHLAICERGVWDKGQGPTGVRSETRGDDNMTDEEKKALEAAEAKKKADAEAEEKAKAKADADAGEKLDKVLSCLDSLSKRMDAMEEDDKKKSDKARKDAEEEEAKGKTAEQVAADKARKDAEEKEAEEKTKAEEKAKADAEERQKLTDSVSEVAKKIDAVAGMLPKQLTDADYTAMADAQSRADHVLSALGERAPRPLDGEDLLAYRRRLVSRLKDHSPRWKSVDLGTIADADAFSVVEDQVYADAEVASHSPAAVPDGQLRPVVTVDPTGRRTTSFVGTPATWMRQFSGQARHLTHIGPRRQQH